MKTARFKYPRAASLASRFTSISDLRFKILTAGLQSAFIALLILISSNVQAVNEITVSLRIEGIEGNVLYQDVELPHACTVTDTTGVSHTYTGYKAVCALQTLKEQGVLTYEMVDFGFALALTKINNINTPSDWSQFWIIYHNNASASLGITDQTLSKYDKLLLAYGSSSGPPNYSFPDTLQASYSGDASGIGNELNLSVQKWDSPSNSFVDYTGNATFYINNIAYSTIDGTVSWKVANAGNNIIYVESEDAIRSAVLSFDYINENSSLSSKTARNTVNPASATDFIADTQNMDGSFIGGALVTDWTAIALAATDQNLNAREEVRKYLLTNPQPGQLVTDYERRAMALMALGVNPYDVMGVNYIQPIIDAFDGRQIGNPEFTNDDIFALLVLRKAGYGLGEKIITSLTKHILESQNQDGSWPGGVDMTAAAIQALVTVRNLQNVESALETAELSLRREQKDDGGFGDEFSTPWAIQAIVALGKSEADWYKNNLTPGEYLGNRQGKDGGLLEDQPAHMRLWATAYAVPAEFKKSWLDILQEFKKDTSGIVKVPQAFGAHEVAPVVSDLTTKSPNHLTTSTTKFTTSTPEFTTSTTRTNFSSTTLDFSTSTYTLLETPGMTSSTTSTVFGDITTSTPEVGLNIPEITSSTTSTFIIEISTSTPVHINTSTLEHLNTVSSTQYTSTSTDSLAIENTTENKEQAITKDEQKSMAMEREIDTEEIIHNSTTDDLGELTNQILAPTSSTAPRSPFQKTARNIFRTALALATTLGAYLAWRVVQTVV